MKKLYIIFLLVTVVALGAYMIKVGPKESAEQNNLDGSISEGDGEDVVREIAASTKLLSSHQGPEDETNLQSTGAENEISIEARNVPSVEEERYELYEDPNEDGTLNETNEDTSDDSSERDENEAAKQELIDIHYSCLAELNQF
jgi:hypothetical protein